MKTGNRGEAKMGESANRSKRAALRLKPCTHRPRAEACGPKRV